MKTFSATITVLLFVLSFSAVPSFSQGTESGSINVTGTVLERLTVIPTNDLELGFILPGESKTIAPDAAEAGSFFIQGDGGREVELSFTLPSVLELITDPANTMSLIFSETSAIHNIEDDASAGATFDPDTGTTMPLNVVNGELYVFIGATVDATPTQEPGNYEATVTLTLEYTGN
ncbi:DUF4402 domain-containing protein [Balneolaceae bacterium ANBcel3]|nr:DUF4402 domain-containing protein [Balneolaceae bacterium ANBcel3]